MGSGSTPIAESRRVVLASQCSPVEKVDLKKRLPDYFAGEAKKSSLVRRPPCHYPMVDGEGDPSTSPNYGRIIGLL